MLHLLLCSCRSHGSRGPKSTSENNKLATRLLHRFYSIEKASLSFDCKFADGVEEVLPLLLLGPQTLLMLVEPAAQSAGLLGSQVQGLVLLTLQRENDTSEELETCRASPDLIGPGVRADLDTDM